jgi:pyruvate kinase
MNVARLNFSHGDYDYFEKVIKKIRKVSKEIAILLDTKGPEIRADINSDKLIVNEGDLLKVTNLKNDLDSKTIYIDYSKLMELKIGNFILIDDGLLELKVINKKNNYLEVKAENNAELGKKKTVSIWGHKVEIDFLSKKDIEDIKFGIKMNVDFIAASFVRKKEDILEIKNLLKKEKAERIKIISKIEHADAVDNIIEIVENSDGIMIARGDLGVEMPIEKVPKVQFEIINICRKYAKPVIVATQMLESMKENPRPTRAEVNDVANAIIWGADAIMLSGETASGKYPVKSVKTMSKIAKEYERKDLLKILNLNFEEKKFISSFITKAAFKASEEIDCSKVIIAPTISGYTAKKVSSYRPKIPILAITHDYTVLRQLMLNYGVFPKYLKHQYKNNEHLLKTVGKIAKEENYLKNEDDVAIIIYGFKLNVPAHTNTLEIFKARDL